MNNPLIKLAKMFGKDLKNSARMFSVGNTENGLVIDLYGIVGDYWDSNEAQDLLNILNRNRNVQNIQLNVHSYGGYVMEGLAILNQLRDHPANVTATVQGTAASMASVIIMAADKVLVHENSWIMIHEAEALAVGRADDLESNAKWLRDINQQAADLYQSKTGLPIEEIQQMMTAETWMTGKEAVELGFADELIPLQKAQETASAQMRAVAGQPLAFASLDVYNNIPLDCLPVEQTATLSAKMTAAKTNQNTTEQNAVTDKKKKATTEQIEAAKTVLQKQKNAPSAEDIEAAKTVLETAGIDIQKDGIEIETEKLDTKKEITDANMQSNSKQIAELCTLAGKPEKITAFLSDDKTPDEVRIILAAEKNAELNAIPDVNAQIGNEDKPTETKGLVEMAKESCKKQGLTPRF